MALIRQLTHVKMEGDLVLMELVDIIMVRGVFLAVSCLLTLI
jgi:hypothetical protein